MSGNMIPPQSTLNELGATAIVKLKYEYCEIIKHNMNAPVYLKEETEGWVDMTWNDYQAHDPYTTNKDGSDMVRFFWMGEDGVGHTININYKELDIVEKLPCWELIAG
jgi:hypothetical protein